MRVSFTHGPDGTGIATYTTDWHVRDGVHRYRRVVVSRHFVYSRLMHTQTVEYRVSHVEHVQDGAERVLLNAGVSTFAASIDMLRGELSRLVTAGFAHKDDLERVPTVPRQRPVAA